MLHHFVANFLRLVTSGARQAYNFHEVFAAMLLKAVCPYVGVAASLKNSGVPGRDILAL